MELLCPLIIGAFISGVVGYFIGQTKNDGQRGAALGAVLGPVGWIIEFLLPVTPTVGEFDVGTFPSALPPPSTTPCAFCRTPMDPLATVCARCLREQPPKPTEASLVAEMAAAVDEAALHAIAVRATTAGLASDAVNRLREARDARLAELRTRS